MQKVMREPQQARSRETLERILAAAIKCAGASIDGDFTLREVALAAGISQGTLHTRFPTKDGLVLLVHERFWQERLARLGQALDTLVTHARNAPQTGLRAHMRPLLVSGLTQLREDFSATRTLRRVFDRAIIDSGRLSARHRHFLREAFGLVTVSATDIARLLGFELQGPSFNWAILMVLAGMKEPHPFLASSGFEVSDAAICHELSRLLCELIPDR